ncbi:MAG: hypothetical protein WAQ98_01425, partial [Blastocatellia bacterium]
MVDTFGYDSRRFPFGKDFALNIIDQYNRKLEDNAEYTLSKVLQDPILLRNYQNDFNVGGWNGFLINTQYPQNNYVGFQMLATEHLAKKLAGTSQTNVQKVQDKLDQGMGFLSPQRCATRPEYNNGKNEFKQPRFSGGPIYKFEATVANVGETEAEYNRQKEEYDKRYSAQMATAQKTWEGTNTCPPRPDGSSGFETTTPGSVVANQIQNAMGSNFRTTELAAAMGNSISAITDAFINKFIGKGLNALTTRTNPTTPEEDTWDYYGNTLGSPSNNDAWNTGPDQEIKLEDFKGDVNTAIQNTSTELQLLDNTSTNNPGLIQLLSQTWPKSRELDMCIPGPGLKWEERLIKETQRNGAKLQEKANDDDGEKAAIAQGVYNELQFAAKYFADWIKNKMMTELPHSIEYIDAVDEVNDLSQQASELTDKIRTRKQALARLQAVHAALNNPDTFPLQPSTGSRQPPVGSNAERTLISLKKQYDATINAAGNTFTIDESINDVAIAKERLNNLNRLITQCGQERIEKGWTNPGGKVSTYLDKGTEQNLFCDFPIKGGYNHDSFNHAYDKEVGPGTVTHPELPYVNARDIYQYRSKLMTGLTLGFGGKKHVDIKLSCNLIYKATVLDYKGNLPGTTNIVEPPDNSADDTATPPYPDETNPTTTGSTADTTPTGQLTCSPANQTVHVGQSINFTATGGNGTYAWDQNDANPATGSGASWVTVWA